MLFTFLKHSLDKYYIYLTTAELPHIYIFNQKVQLFAFTMVIMTLELCGIFSKIALYSRRIFRLLQWIFLKISGMIDIVVENTHATNRREVEGTDFSL